MNKVMRAILVVAGTGGIFLAVAFYFQWSWVQDFWPWAGQNAAAQTTDYFGYSVTAASGDLTRLSYYFISSILAAISLPVIWIGLAGEGAAITGGALDLLITYSGLTVYMLQSYQSSNNERLLVAGLVCLSGGIVSLVLLFWSRRFVFADQRLLPLAVRLAFGVFILALISVGGALITKQPHIFPWPLAAEVSIVYGWVFLGAAAYFVYALAVPRWQNACGQLLGFLAYDLVLILPFLKHFDDVAAEHRTSLIIYTAVVIVSGLLAGYYLFLHVQTRIWSPGRKQALPVT